MIHYLDLQRINDSFEPQLSDEIKRVIRSGKYLAGEEAGQFESQWAAYLNVPHCIGTASGMSALMLILAGYKELGVMQENDEVIVPANSFIATPVAVLSAGLKPVLCEPSPDTYTLNPNRIEPLLTPRTKAIIAVHTYGQCADMPAIHKIARKHNLKVIEDASQAAGASLHRKHAGNLGDAAAFSFNPESNLGGLGDGGAVTTNDQSLAEVVRSLGNYGSTWENVHTRSGIASNLDEIQAVVLKVKLKRLDADNACRRKIARRYLNEIDHPFITLPRIENPNNHAFYAFPVLCQRRDILRARLLKSEIQTMIHYPVPPHHQGALKEYRNCFLPITEQIHREELSLPISPLMSRQEVDRVIGAVNSFE